MDLCLLLCLCAKFIAKLRAWSFCFCRTLMRRSHSASRKHVYMILSSDISWVFLPLGSNKWNDFLTLFQGFSFFAFYRST